MVRTPNWDEPSSGYTAKATPLHLGVCGLLLAACHSPWLEYRPRNVESMKTKRNPRPPPIPLYLFVWHGHVQVTTTGESQLAGLMVVRDGKSFFSEGSGSSR